MLPTSSYVFRYFLFDKLQYPSINSIQWIYFTGYIQVRKHGSIESTWKITHTLLTINFLLECSRFSTYSDFGEDKISKKQMLLRIEISLVFKYENYVKYSITFKTSHLTDRFNMVSIYFLFFYEKVELYYHFFFNVV